MGSFFTTKHIKIKIIIAHNSNELEQTESVVHEVFGTSLIVFHPVQFHDNNLLSTQFTEDGLEDLTESSTHVRSHKARQGVGGSTHDVDSEPLISCSLQLDHRASTGHLAQ